MTGRLPAEVRDLLKTVTEALLLPLPAAPEDERVYLKLVEHRAWLAHAALSVFLAHPDDAAGAHGIAMHVRRQVAAYPVTYRPWAAAGQDGGAS